LRVFECVIRNCRNAIDYQFYLDLSKEWQVQRPFEIGGLKTIPEWIAIRKVARAEIDNTNLLIELLASGKPDLIDRAATETETDIRVLDHALMDSLRRKVKIMIAHWEDYERLFTTYGNEQRNRSSDAWEASVHP
jgi:hypothetical protein